MNKEGLLPVASSAFFFIYIYFLRPMEEERTVTLVHLVSQIDLVRADKQGGAVPCSFIWQRDLESQAAGE